MYKEDLPYSEITLCTGMTHHIQGRPNTLKDDLAYSEMWDL